MEERIKISDVKWLQTELEKIESRLSAVESKEYMPNRVSILESRIDLLEEQIENHNPAPTSPFTDDNNPAAPQPVRIRPEDMVMVKWVGFDKPAPKKMSDIAKHDNYHVEWLSPIQPVRREWMKAPDKNELVWCCYVSGETGKQVVAKVQFGHVAHCDLWQPVLSPDEPAPEAPCEVE